MTGAGPATCCICFETKKQVPVCAVEHTVCADCCEPLYKHFSTCPLCRRALLPNPIKRNMRHLTLYMRTVFPTLSFDEKSKYILHLFKYPFEKYLKTALTLLTNHLRTQFDTEMLIEEVYFYAAFHENRSVMEVLYRHLPDDIRNNARWCIPA